MIFGESPGLVIGAVLLGAVHGIEPGHGWPVAATYALEQTNKWFYGLAAGTIIGIGHLVSSIAMVAVFFAAKGYFGLAQINDPVRLEVLSTTIAVGGPVSLVAGVLLVLLGLREYRHGHVHDSHDDGHDHTHGSGGIGSRLRRLLPSTTGGADRATDRGLFGIAWVAFVLGFAHEEEFEIIALCAGSDACLRLMSVYALTVLLGIVGLTMLLVAGYQHFEERVDRYTPYLPVVSAVVLVGMGLGFIAGVL